MTTTSSVSGTSSSSNNSSNTALQNIDTDEFLKLMIAELQNQDPLDPADNTQLLTQISQIRQVSASDKLSSTLDSVLLGQNLSSGTNLIGKKIAALGDDQKDLSGVVDKVTVAGGVVKVHIGERTASLTNVREILPTNAAS
ncbi:MAG: flagellar hook capping FlgD N-terminal domain-containing protein [Pirellulales bacterium]|nr:flagellar hook capping FlgD N-terminal domain-containing protein [Pirellulales bacterium]